MKRLFLIIPMKKKLAIIVWGISLILGTVPNVMCQWQQTYGPYGGGATCLVVIDSNAPSPSVLAGGYIGQIFLSTNNGLDWASINNGMPSAQITAIAVSGTTRFVSTTDNGVFISRTTDNYWRSANNGLTGSQVHAFAVSDPNASSALVFACANGVFLSSDSGNSWVNRSSGLPSGEVLCLYINGSNPSSPV